MKAQNRIAALILITCLAFTASKVSAQDTLKQVSSQYVTDGKPESNSENAEIAIQAAGMNMPVSKKRYTDYPYYFQLRYDFYTTLMASFARNPIDPNIDKSNVYFYYNITLNNRLQLNKVRINTFLFNELWTVSIRFLKTFIILKIPLITP
jgi:hypothetical protein